MLYCLTCNNSNSIYFKSLKSQWSSGVSGPYMSNRQHTQIQTFKCTQNEKMKKTSPKIHIQVNILK